MTPTNLKDFLKSLEGGVLYEALENILSDVAFATRNNDRRVKGRVNISLTFEKFADEQVMVSHKIDYKKPTNKGSIQEDRQSSTPMFVNKGGELTLFRKDQEDMFLDPPNVIDINKKEKLAK